MRIYWLIPNRVIYFKLRRNATLDVVKADNRVIIAMLNEGQGRVHIVIDASEIGLIPTDVNAAIRANSFTQHPELALVVAVNVNKLHQILAQIAARMTHREVRFVQSVNAAIELLQREDTTLEAAYTFTQHKGKS